MGSRTLLAGALFLISAAWASPSAADGEGTLAEKAPSPRSSWYGYQTFSADATAAALTLVAFQTNSGAASWGAIGVYLLGAPAVHAAHGRPLAVVGSLGLRIGVPLLVSALGAATADCSTRVVNDDNCTFGPSIVGLGVGIVMAAIIDSAAIAWSRPSPAVPDRPAPSPAPWSIRLLAPSPVPLRGGGGLAFGGLF
jgi:hypothetical protein